MLRALDTAATGMQAQQINIDTIANNIADVNTTGFKQGRAEFQDLLYQNIRPAGTASSSSTEDGSFHLNAQGAVVTADGKVRQQPPPQGKTASAG